MMLSLSISVLLLGLMSSTVVELGRAESVIAMKTEQSAMWFSAQRVIRQDVHGAIRLSLLSGSAFSATEADGRMFQYSVNSGGQLVRVQVGGGSAVVAVGVRTMVAALTQDGISVRLVFTNGFDQTFRVTDVLAEMSFSS